MRQIFVEPDYLDRVAEIVENSCSDYETVYHNLLSEVEKMQASWTGKDNSAFTNQIHKYESDFSQIAVIMKQYVSFLRNSSRAYRETQEELYAQAMRLEV